MKQFEVVKDLNGLISILSHRAVKRLAKNISKDVEDKTEIMLLYSGKSEKNGKIRAELSYRGEIVDKDKKVGDLKSYLDSLQQPQELVAVAKRDNANT